MILISSEECLKLQDNKMKYLPDKELCAGHKVFRRIDAYKYYKNSKWPRSNKRCPYCPDFRRVKLSKHGWNREVKYGQTYSCTGDSGGPLWKWMRQNNKKKARIIHLCSLLHISMIDFQIFRPENL